MQVLNKVYNLRKFLPSQKVQDSSLQHSMKYILIAAQCFALLPVNGITKDVDSLRFKWISVKTFYSIFTILLEIMYILIICSSSQITFERFFSFEVIVWNVRALLLLLLFLKLAQRWPQFLKEWYHMEMAMVEYGPIPTLKLRFQILSFAFAVIGILEHSLFVYGGITKTRTQIKDGDNFIKKYFEVVYPETFNLTEYSHCKAIIVEFLSITSTFTWQFCDLFIILVSTALAERLRQITMRINSRQVQYESQWRDIRKQYNQLSLLCRSLNCEISEIVLLSFFGNVYFLSVNIFQSFSFRITFEAIYFWCGILCILFHFVIVCLYAAWVHEESTKSIAEILCVPAMNTSYEIDRLLNQMAVGYIAIYGGRLFRITRSTILQVSSVILTLQLIFYQFKTQITSNIA